MTEKNFRVRQQTLTQTQLLRLLINLEHCTALVSGDRSKSGNVSQSNPENLQALYSIYTGDPLVTAKTDKQVKQIVNDAPKLKEPYAQLPFVKGWIGAKGYSAELDFYGYFSWSYTYCHDIQQGLFVFSDECPAELEEKVLQLTNNESPVASPTIELRALSWEKSQSLEHYAKSFARLQDYILAGDCYQANLTQRFEADCAFDKADLLALFFNTAARSSANYCVFIGLERENYLLSFSPEQFIESNNRQLKSKPIKGTIRSRGPITDAEQEVLLNEKNKAENLMIVDLLRNDMSKVSELNSVKVPELFAIESYENVHHLVSTIESKLGDHISEFEAFCAAFPGGSITGAPKKRAMEIIEELEVHPRRYYCGSVFYWDYRGNFDSNILIRTVEKLNDKLYCWAGGGIVADSELESEYQESIDKVRHITGLED